MKSLYDFQDDYVFKITGLSDYISTQKKIEIAEFKLGIYNPDSSIADVDMLDNPTYKEWKHYDMIYKGQLYRRVLIRPGKTNITRVLIEQDIKKNRIK
jgi:hypothetical protein